MTNHEKLVNILGYSGDCISAGWLINNFYYSFQPPHTVSECCFYSFITSGSSHCTTTKARESLCADSKSWHCFLNLLLKTTTWHPLQAHAMVGQSTWSRKRVWISLFALLFHSWHHFLFMWTTKSNTHILFMTACFSPHLKSWQF